MIHHRPRTFARVVLTTLLLLLTAHCSLLTGFGQSSTATLSGTVTDPNGAVVPGVKVTVTDPATRLQRTAVTNDGGQFVVPLLPPSTYELTLERAGFMTAAINNVVLNVNDERSLTIKMRVGDVNETVNVTDEAPLINESPAVATVVDRQFVENIPLNGRSFQALITLTPGVVLVPLNTLTGGAGEFSINGQRANANYFTVDGVSANVSNGVGVIPGQATSGTLPAVSASGGTNGLVSIDALQEFKIQTSTYAAEFGRSPGGQISFLTRSGTNAFHGSLFDYVRNDIFDANDWFANRTGQRRPPLRQNNFGATLGGPVFFPNFGEGGNRWYNGRNKTFFFFSYEGLRLRAPKFATTNVPTLALRQAAPAGLRTLLNVFPLPNGRDLGNGLAEFSASYSDSSKLDSTSVRLDHTIGDRLSVFGRVSKAPSNSLPRRTSNLAGLNPTTQDLLTVTGGVTFSATQNMTNDLKVNYSLNKGTFGSLLDNFGGAVPIDRSSLIPSQFDVGPGTTGGLLLLFPGFTVLPVINVGGSAASQRQVNIVDNLSHNLGPHQLKFGIDYRRLAPSVEGGLYSISLTYPTQADVINNRAAAFVQSGLAIKPIYKSFSAYAQDTWKLSRQLTLSYGLRWELNPSPREANGADPRAISGLENLATADVAPQGTPLWKTTYNNFAPRLGVAYLLSQSPGRETMVRGGFGIFYDTGTSEGSAAYRGYPFVISRSVAAVSVPFVPAQVAPPPFGNFVPPYGTIYVFDPELKLPYTMHWNFAVEQSLGKHQVFSATYVGNVGRRLIAERRFNLAPVNPRFTTLNLFDNSATSDYHSMQLQFQRRLSGGLQALASYTWAHAIDLASSDFVTDLVLTRGNSDFDIRHNFTAAITYNVPPPHSNPIVNALLRGWSIDSRINAQSAFPINIISGQFIDPVDGTVKARRANLVGGVPIYIENPSMPGGRVVNRAAFSGPATGQQGTLGRNVVRAFPTWQVDIALRRQLKLTERFNLQLRAEAFNVFNHPNFGAIQTTLTAANFGQATNMLGRRLGGLNPLYQVGGPRSLQFALKLMF